MIDCQMFGPNAGAHHFVNVLFHAANTALLFILLLRLTNRLWPCVFVGALFALHPLHVESVAWISERKDVLSTFFGLLTLLSYAKYTKEKSRQSYWLAIVFFALGLMSKPMLVTLPFVMLLLDYWPGGRIEGDRTKQFKLVTEKWPFFLLVIISCVVTYIAQSHGAVRSLKDVPLGYRLENASVAAVTYLLKMIWPVNLGIIYPMPDSIPAMTVILSTIVLISITAVVWLARKQNPFLLMGWLWFCGTLVPVIGIVKVGDAAFADRYTYIPSIGIFIAIAFGAENFSRHLRLPKFILPAVVVLIFGTFLALTEKQLSYWRDDASLFGHTLRVTVNNPDATINYGVALEKNGHPHEALAQYREAARLAPGSAIVHNNLGNLLDNLGEREESIAEYREAIRLAPNMSSLHVSLGIVLGELGKFAEGMREFTNAAHLNPKSSSPAFQMGKALLQQGRDAEAIDKFREALRLDPDNFKILAYIAHVLASAKNDETRDGKTALLLAVKANALTGGQQPLVLDALGMALAETGDFTNALEVTQRAVDIATVAKIKNLEEMRQRLEIYRNHQPWRESFLTTNAATKN